MPEAVFDRTKVNPMDLRTGVNTAKWRILKNVEHAIRLGYPQARPYPVQAQPVVVLCGGPSLNLTMDELHDQIMDGAKVVTVNGAYQWAIDRHIRPSLQIVMDARPCNARFLETPVPKCRYLLASQCAPETWAQAAGRDVWIWHALTHDDEELAILDRYYGKDHHHPVQGGSTVALRAISLLRMLGFFRLDLYGFDSCWLDDQHHAYEQPENARDHCLTVWSIPTTSDGQERLELRKSFRCAPWHVKQAQDFELLTKTRGHLFQLHVHGPGLIAHMIQMGTRLVQETTDERSSQGRPAPSDSQRDCTPDAQAESVASPVAEPSCPSRP